MEPLSSVPLFLSGPFFLSERKKGRGKEGDERGSMQAEII
jgi:hypothetical protein